MIRHALIGAVAAASLFVASVAPSPAQADPAASLIGAMAGAAMGAMIGGVGQPPMGYRQRGGYYRPRHAAAPRRYARAAPPRVRSVAPRAAPRESVAGGAQTTAARFQ